jgi:hypothetical protein
MPHARVLIAPAFILLAACGGSEQPAVEEQGELVIGGEPAQVMSMYEMPTPNELFGLVRQMAGEGHKRMLSPASYADRFVSLRARSVNFGVFATDLVYASSFKLNVEVARYYLASKKLAASLGLDQAFSDADFVRLEANLTRGDSLEVISNQAYLKAYEKMQREEMGPVLHMVLAGGWLESMHLVIKQIEAFGQSEALMARVAEQKVTLDHLLGMMEGSRNDPDAAQVYADLAAVRAIYDQLEVKHTAHAGASPSGRMVLGDDVTIDLTPTKYKELTEAVEAIRARWTQPEDGANPQ